jgi:lipopolysaccharide export system ATP-binding protein
MKLEARGLKKSYGARQAVKNVGLMVQEGEVVGLLGPNGAGKTTIFHMLVGLIPVGGGEILLNGQRITGQPLYRRARMGIAYLAQEPSVFRKLTVEENLMVVLETVGLSPSEREERLHHLLKELNIAHLSSSPAYTLSGGERRRVEITRALASGPMFLLLDEPFAGIDPIAVVDLQKIIGQLKARGMGILITDHNVQETLAITDRAYIINSGEILTSGTPQEIERHPEARTFYLGESFKLQYRS